MPIIQINPKIIEYSQKIQTYCFKKGGSFRKGCPNYGKKQGCPPNQPLINKIFDFDKPIYLIYTNFDVKEIAERMAQKHPEWTEKQCYNSRYWQQTARNLHEKEIEKFLEKNKQVIVKKSPEAHGVNIHSLMWQATKIKLEWPPRNLTRLVSLAGYKY